MVTLGNISLNLEGKQILENISFNTEESCTEIILGPSGAGKSSILKVILGLWKPQSGRVIINGEDISRYSEAQMLKIRRNIGIVFQSNALFDSLTVNENVCYFLKEQKKLQKAEIRARVKEALNFVNMKDEGVLYPAQLSGGMKKRAAIARAMAFEPGILLFDEPTGGLDPINAKAIDELIKKVHSKGTTIIVVTHSVHEAIFLGDKLTVINKGRIVESSMVDELLNSKNKFVQEFLNEYNLEQNVKYHLAEKVTLN